MGTREEMYKKWKAMTPGQRRAVVLACVESITVYPATTSGRFDPDRLDPQWR